MSVERGSAFLLKVGNGATPVAYQTVAGLRTTQLSVNGEMVAVTSKDSGGWRDLLSGAGVRSVSVSGAGVFTGSAAELRIKASALAGTLDDYRMSFESGETDYGNRIPSLTFEVIGDAAPVGVGEIVRELSAGLVTGDVALSLPGFAAYGDARSVLELLAGASGGWFAPAGRGIVLRDGLAVSAVLDDAGFAAGETPGARGVRSLAAIEDAACSVAIAHYDPARDYQAGLQRARGRDLAIARRGSSCRRRFPRMRPRRLRRPSWRAARHGASGGH